MVCVAVVAAAAPVPEDVAEDAGDAAVGGDWDDEGVVAAVESGAGSVAESKLSAGISSAPPPLHRNYQCQP